MQNVRFDEQEIDVARSLTTSCVCPFARQVIRDNSLFWSSVGNGLLSDPISLCASLQQTLRAFVSSGAKVMVLFMADKPTNHDEAHLAAKRLFLELGIYGEGLGGPKTASTTVRERWTVTLLPALAIPHCRIDNPNISIKLRGSSIVRRYFVFAMNPLYHRTHPRFSPKPMLVLTAHADLDWARVNAVRTTEKIREKTSQALASAYGVKQSQANPALTVVSPLDFYIYPPDERIAGLYRLPGAICNSSFTDE